MATGQRRKRTEAFTIHEDAPSEETQLNEDLIPTEVGSSQQHAYGELEDDDHGVEVDDVDEGGDEAGDGNDMDDIDVGVDADVDEDDNEEQGHDEDEAPDSSDDEAVDETVQHDMEKLQSTFPSFQQQFRLIKRIGEGTFSTVYKAEDLQYDRFDNSWDWEKENEKWASPPLKPTARQRQQRQHRQQQQPRNAQKHGRRSTKYVAIKKIYVTSSPLRIFNELELLHDLRQSPSVCPLITAFRQTDQVVAVLPYFRHQDFRAYYRDMTVPDMAIYLRALFTALSAVHAARILHRDIKPTNFLYDPATRRGVLVDFGLAEREGSDSKPCLCHELEGVRKSRLRTAYANGPMGGGGGGGGALGGVGIGGGAGTGGGGGLGGAHNGYPKNDTRPSRRANRAGTRGFRAPEVLFKCTEQTTKIDIWSAGVVLLTLLSRRFPFFNSADDVEAMIEIATIFGSKRMKVAAQLHGCMLETTIPTVGREGFSLEKIILWSTCRMDNSKTLQPLTEEEKLAVRFLGRCLDLDPSSRISADEALQHEFLRERPLGVDVAAAGEGGGGDDDDDEMDIL